MPRERRQAVQTNAAMYVGYADDDEDVDSIMKKFKALEEVAEAKRSAGAADLSEEDLVKAVGLRVGCGVDYSMDADRAGAGGASGSRHRGPKGEHVQTGEVQIVPAHVAPEELDAADAADAKRRLKAGPDYLPPAQRRDEQVTMPSLVPLELNKDVVMVELEGIYAACREAAFAAMPASVAEEERHAFLDALTRELRLMAARGTPKEERTLEKAAHKVVETIEKAYEKTTTVASSAPIVDAPDDGASTMAPDAARRCAAALARAAARDSKSGSKSALRVRSKGTGLICVRPGGIAPNTYLGAYCGELYPGWRWYEKEAAAQAVRRDVRTSLDEVPVFYNAAVERDGDDPRGYDCLFIDGAVKGSILTRASHSCAPNAAMRVRVRDGAYAVEMASVERVRVGDEICWDYRCRTDSEREMRAALCLCGSRRCRVSYLHFAGHDDTSCVLKKRGTVAHFTAALLRACGPCGDGRARTERDSVANESNALSSGSAAAAAAADAALARRAAQAGFKAGTRDAPGVLFGLPAWLTRYVAFCVAFAAEEREALAEVLEARFAAETNASDEKVTRATTESGANESKSASRLDAEAEAEGVHAGRLQSLAVTLDKVRHVLVHACGGEDKIATAPPPLAALDDAAATAHLAATRRRVADAARALGVDVPEDRVSRSASHKKKPSEYDELVEARRALASLATSLRTQVAQVDTHVVSAACSAAADLCDLAARTKTFFRAVPVRAFESPFVQVGKFDGGDAGTTRRASYGPLSAWAFLVTWHAEFEERADGALELETRGATRLPRPDGPLRRSAMRGGMNENAKASDLQTFAAFGPKKNPKIPRGPIGAQPERFALDLLDASRGAVFEPWPAVLGWEWARLRDVADASLRQSEAGACEDAKTQRDEGGETVGETRGSDGVFGSPALDDALAEAEDADGVASADAEDASGADGSYEDAAMLLARARTRKSASDVETDDTLSAPACVPAWNADRGLGVTFVASRGDQIALGPRGARRARPKLAGRRAAERRTAERRTVSQKRKRFWSPRKLPRRNPQQRSPPATTPRVWWSARWPRWRTRWRAHRARFARWRKRPNASRRRPRLILKRMRRSLGKTSRLPRARARRRTATRSTRRRRARAAAGPARTGTSCCARAAPRAGTWTASGSPPRPRGAGSARRARGGGWRASARPDAPASRRRRRRRRRRARWVGRRRVRPAPPAAWPASPWSRARWRPCPRSGRSPPTTWRRPSWWTSSGAPRAPPPRRRRRRRRTRASAARASRSAPSAARARRFWTRARTRLRWKGLARPSRRPSRCRGRARRQWRWSAAALWASSA